MLNIRTDNEYSSDWLSSQIFKAPYSCIQAAVGDVHFTSNCHIHNSFGLERKERSSYLWGCFFVYLFVIEDANDRNKVHQVFTPSECDTQ